MEKLKAKMARLPRINGCDNTMDAKDWPLKMAEAILEMTPVSGT